MKVKYSIIAMLVLCLAATNDLTAQVNYMNSDTSIVADGYGGLFGSTAFSNQKPHSSYFASLRAGASVQWNISKNFYFRSFGVVDLNTDSEVSGFGVGWLSYSPAKCMTIQVGDLPSTLAAYLRPYPVSWYGQFEFLSQGLIPGSGLGAKLKFQLNKDLFVEGAVMHRDSFPEYQLLVGNDIFKGGAFFSKEKIGAVLEYKGTDSNPYVMITGQVDISGDEYRYILGSGFFWEFNSQKHLGIFYDVSLSNVNMSMDGVDIEIIELGLGKTAQLGKHFNGLFSLSGAYSTEDGFMFRTGFMLSL